MSAQTKLIDARDLKKVYTMGEVELMVLKGIDLIIEQGEFVAITGFSGSGKSTLMHLLGCLDIPTEGEYFLDGVNVAQASKNELAQIRNEKIGFVFQKFHLLTDLTALDNVALPRLYSGQSESQARKEAAQYLTMVNLQERMDHYPYQLSGGQQQRVAIARSLVNNPNIIFADEPTGNLDSATGETIMGIFKELNDKHNVTLVMVTHEPIIAAKAKRIIELVDGKIIADKKIHA
jgi:putative ABC transport system ATP-binding protein